MKRLVVNLKKMDKILYLVDLLRQILKISILPYNLLITYNDT